MRCDDTIEDPSLREERERPEVARFEIGFARVLVCFFSSRRRHTRYWRDWSSDVCSSDLGCSPEAVGFLSKLFRYEGAKSTTLSPDVREAELLSANITHAISDLLDAVAAESTVLVVLEDAQWLDAISMRVLADLAAERKRRPLLLIFTSRESELGAPQRGFTRLHVPPLPPREARLLVVDVLHRASAESDEDLLQWLLAVAAGNPLFLQSLAAHYAATRDRRSIPAPLSALLRERPGTLDRRARRVFEACAVLGRHSTVERLRRVLGLPSFELLDA